MSESVRSIVFWCVMGVIPAFWLWGLISYFREHGLRLTDETKENSGYFFIVLGFFLLLFFVWFPIDFTLEHVLPDYSAFHGTNEDGEPFDRRAWIALLIAFPATYLLIRGFIAWKKDIKRK